MTSFSIPTWLRHRDTDDGGGPTRRAAEAAVLIVIGLLLAAATVDDVARQVRLDKRLSVDKATWRAHTGYHAKRIFVTPGVGTNTDVACAPPARNAGYRVCLILAGPSSGPRRSIAGGFRLPPTGDNRYARRSACFGSAAAEHLCPR